MHRFFKLIIFLFLTIPCFAQDAETETKINYYKEKAQKYLDKQKGLSDYYLIDKDGIKIFASSVAKKNRQFEFFIQWNELENFNYFIKNSSSEKINAVYNSKSYTREIEKKINDVSPITNNALNKKASTSLKQLKIAIDPGHIAHDLSMGDIEKKHLKINGDKKNGLNDSIEIAEGMLTYATAILLKEKLEKEGAIVFLTRKADTCAFGKTFAQWKKEDLKNTVEYLSKTGELSPSQKGYLLSEKAKDSDIFRDVFKNLELAKRVELINKFNPDYTIVIHYNVDETNLGWTKTTNKNFNMAFVGGAFMKHDLSNKKKRFEFLRLLITDDLEKSVALSASVVKSFEKELNIPTSQTKDAKYLTEGCLPTSENGVFCRNLQLTRYIHSPLVYGETIYQDNINECKLLNEETDKTKNKRVQQVADAYYKGILNYIATFSKK